MPKNPLIKPTATPIKMYSKNIRIPYFSPFGLSKFRFLRLVIKIYRLQAFKFKCEI